MTDKSTELQMLDVRDIVPYEHNPRQSNNPEYDAIKASIRIDGMIQPLVVTRRPGADAYTVGAGGNTRLQIVKELFEETGDACYARIPCRVIAWTDDAQVLLAHLKENDLRGDLSFIDRARAVLDLKARLELEEGRSELSHRALAAELTTRGYPISHNLVIDMSYAVEKLLDGTPAALSAGLSRGQVQKIRLLDKACTALWENRVADDDPFDAVFIALCRRHDGPDWDLASLRRSLEHEIAERSETSVPQVSLALEAALNGRTSDPLAAGDVAGNASGDFDTEIREVVRREEGKDASSRDERSEPRKAIADPHQEPIPSAGESADSSPALDSEPDPDQTTPAGVPPEPLQEPQTASAIGETIQSNLQAGALQTAGRDLKSLRARAWTLAARLAQRNGIGELIQPLSGQGLGYMLTDVPAPALAEHLDEDDLARVSMLWWQLAACAELTVAPVEWVVPHLDPDSVLRQALEDQDGALLFKSVWTLDPGHTGYRLWRGMDDRDWQDYVGLLDTYRTLYQVAVDTDTALWG